MQAFLPVSAMSGSDWWRIFTLELGSCVSGYRHRIAKRHNEMDAKTDARSAVKIV